MIGESIETAVRLFRDGDIWCCVGPKFVDFDQSYAGYGKTIETAYADLMEALKCECCEGTGTVPDRHTHSVDIGSRWERMVVDEVVNIECPECHGAKVIC